MGRDRSMRGLGGYMKSTHRGDVRLIVCIEVSSKQRVQLQWVQLETGILDVLRVFHWVLIHGQEHGCLETVRQNYFNSLYWLEYVHWHIIKTLGCKALTSSEIYYLKKKLIYKIKGKKSFIKDTDPKLSLSLAFTNIQTCSAGGDLTWIMCPRWQSAASSRPCLSAQASMAMSLWRRAAPQ